MLIFSTVRSRAAMVSLNLLASTPDNLADPRYLDGESMLLRTTSGGQTFTLSATNYGGDELSTDRWGLIDDSKPWNRGKAGALLQAGFAPNAVGSTKHTYIAGKGSPPMDTYASYLSLTINKSSATLFTSVQVNLIASTLALATTAWAGTSADNFATAITTKGRLSGQGLNVSWDFSNLNYQGDAPLELRFYGLMGADSALLKNVQIQLNATPVPEAKSILVLASCGLWFSRRKRSYCSR
jgi:hypothetical protein